MRSRLTVLLILCVPGLLFDGFESTSRGATAANPSSGPHLYYTPESLEALRNRIDENPVIGRAWADLLKRADQLVTDDLVSKAYAESGEGQHGNYGRPSKQMSTMIRCAMRAKTKPEKTVLNGEPVSPVWNPSRQTIEFRVNTRP
jgi:hypothetical protein